MDHVKEQNQSWVLGELAQDLFLSVPPRLGLFWSWDAGLRALWRTELGKRRPSLSSQIVHIVEENECRVMAGYTQFQIFYRQWLSCMPFQKPLPWKAKWILWPGARILSLLSQDAPFITRIAWHLLTCHLGKCGSNSLDLKPGCLRWLDSWICLFLAMET